MRKALRILPGTFVLLPLVLIVFLSLVSRWSYPSVFGELDLSHWAKFLQGSGSLSGSFLLSLGISSFIALVATAFGYWMSKLLYRHAGSRSLLRFAFFPYLIAPVVLGAMLQFYFVRWGLSGSIAGVVIAQLLFVLPFAVLMMSGFWSDANLAYADQARTLGSSEWQLDRSVLLPMARPFLFITFLQSFLISWFEYGITHLISVGKVPTLTIKVMHFIKEADPHQAALAAVLMVIPLMILLVINQRLFAVKKPGW